MESQVQSILIFTFDMGNTGEQPASLLFLPPNTYSATYSVVRH